MKTGPWARKLARMLDERLGAAFLGSAQLPEGDLHSKREPTSRLIDSPEMAARQIAARFDSSEAALAAQQGFVFTHQGETHFALELVRKGRFLVRTGIDPANTRYANVLHVLDAEARPLPGADRYHCAFEGSDVSLPPPTELPPPYIAQACVTRSVGRSTGPHLHCEIMEPRRPGPS